MVFACAGLARLPVAVADTESTVTCKDGTTSKGGKGACSHHGGVASGDMGGPAAAPPPAAPKSSGAAPSTTQGRAAPASPRPGSSGAPAQSGQPTAKCKDGSMSYSAHHSGACSHHGGVAEWLQSP